jgi:hypothetical protein
MVMILLLISTCYQLLSITEILARGMHNKSLKGKGTYL